MKSLSKEVLEHTREIRQLKKEIIDIKRQLDTYEQERNEAILVELEKKQEAKKFEKNFYQDWW